MKVIFKSTDGATGMNANCGCDITYEQATQNLSNRLASGDGLMRPEERNGFEDASLQSQALTCQLPSQMALGGTNYSTQLL